MDGCTAGMQPGTCSTRRAARSALTVQLQCAPPRLWSAVCLTNSGSAFQDACAVLCERRDKCTQPEIHRDVWQPDSLTATLSPLPAACLLAVVPATHRTHAGNALLPGNVSANEVMQAGAPG